MTNYTQSCIHDPNTTTRKEERFCTNSEALAFDFLQNLDEIFQQNYSHMLIMFKSPHTGVLPLAK